MRPLTPVLADAPGLDSFRVVDLIKSCSDGVVTVRIQRNQEPPQRWKNNREWKPIVLRLKGRIPALALGQMWEMDVQRSGERLLVKAGRPYEPSAQDLAWLEKQSKKERAAKDALLSNLDNEPQPKPLKKTPAQQSGVEPSSDFTDAPPESPATAPTLSATNADPSLTPGKMEVVVKLNQFPDDVRTVDKGRLEFVVDTGEALVTITVKPKVFAALEQAQQDYPDWVATISGQMREMTATGFRLRVSGN